MPESAFHGIGLNNVGQSATLDVRGYGGAAIQLTGTWVATVLFEATADGQTWVAVNATASDGSTPATSATANGAYILSAVGFQSVRARVSAWTSGVVVVSLRADVAGPSGGASGGGGGGAVTIADGADVTQGAIADASSTGDNDGTVNAHLRGLSKILADVWDSVSHYLKVSVQNTSLAVTNGISLPAYDYVGLAVASTTDTYTFKSGGAGGATVATVTITYTDSTKAVIATVEKT